MSGDEAGRTEASAQQLTARIRAAAVGTGLLEVLTHALLNLHRPEPDKITLGHEDCDTCDEWAHDAVTCSECFGTYEEYWSPVLWPCPTMQHLANVLRAYPDQAPGLLRAVTR